MSNRFTASARDRELRAIEEKAAEWFGRCELGLTPEQEREFLRWLEADARHGEAMREMDDTWEFLDGLKEIRRPTLEPFRRTPPRRASWPIVFAAAAALMLAAVALWQPWKSAPQVWQAATEAGGMKKLDLPDGSVVHLNASSRVEVRFTAAERRVQLLRGEAHFAVAKNPARPFVVTAGEVSVRAVGTAFNVRRAAAAVEVFVTEGKVRVDDTLNGGSLLPSGENSAATVAPPVESSLLVAGQRATVTLTSAAAPLPAVIAPIAPAEIQEALAWRARQLDFDLTPLAQVAAEFNRYNSHQLVIADTELARQPFGGTFRADNYDVFVQLLEQRFGVVAERGEEQTILRRAGSSR